MRTSKWFVRAICSQCEALLKRNEVMDRHGCCPYCGHISGGTICDYREIVLKEVDRTKWWQLNKINKVTYIGKTESDKEWIIKRLGKERLEK